MSKILITGGAGFIGSHLTDKLISLGYQVIIIDSLLEDRQYYINPQAKLYQLDVCSVELDKIFKCEQFDYVFHLAGQIDVRQSLNNPLNDARVNLAGSLNVFNSCLKHHVKKVIFFSTAGIYGQVENPVNEEAPKKFDSPYALHKFAAETNLKLLGDLNNLPYIIFRPANVYGPRQMIKAGEGAVIAVFMANALNDSTSFIFGDGQQTRDFLYVEDLVEACLLAIIDKKIGILNIGTGQATSLLSLIKIIEQINGQTFKFEYQPARPGEIKMNVLNPSLAHDLLNWRAQTDLKSGLLKTLLWLKK